MNLGLVITGIAGICGGAVVAAALSAFIIGLGIKIGRASCRERV